MSTVKKDNNTNLIEDAIDSSIKFEKLMDSIDFNSYLLDEDQEVKKTDRYTIYIKLVDKADRIIKEIVCNPSIITIIKLLFEAKKDRLEARKQIIREYEENKFIDAIQKLNKAYLQITSEDFKGKVSKSIYNKNNWAKILLYNEMAICYSGLVEPSISLGYAERAILLLKKIYPKIDQQNGDIPPNIKILYTFALYNKGEAERLLGNLEISLKTLKKIIEFYESEDWQVEKSSDYSQALLRMALILIDLGRGKEAIDYLDKTKFYGYPDYRIQDRDLEKAAALIDKKDYLKAFQHLEEYTKNEWKNTFIQRKTKIYQLRLVLEFKKNLAIDFEKESGEIEKIDKDFEKISYNLLRECIKRYDGDNFRKTCLYLADYIHDKYRKEKWILELSCYYLYLCYKTIFEKRDELEKKSKNPYEIIDDWIKCKEIDFKNLINIYINKNLVKFNEVLKEINDERFLEGFFETYMYVYVKEKDTLPNDNEKEVINNLKERLSAIYHQRDKFTDISILQEKFSVYESKVIGLDEITVRKSSIEFINKCFFKGVPYSNKAKPFTCLHPDSILNIMHQNTRNFAERIVGKTYRFSQKGKLNGILTVLRRWNSFTPAMASSVNPSKGGGYFIYFWYDDNDTDQHKSFGIVIDPGYNFLENLFWSGFRIRDIDIVVISHAHPDHTDNLPSILSLFHESNSRLGEYYFKNVYKKDKFNKNFLKLILSQGVFEQYCGFIDSSKESLEDIIVIQASDIKNPCYIYDKFGDDYSLEIDTFPTFHSDLRQWESLGFIFKILKDDTVIRKIGYTSDAHWRPQFSKNFVDCNIVCAHLGSIVDILKHKEFCSLCKDNKEGSICTTQEPCIEQRYETGESDSNKIKKQAQEQNHLYLSGLTMFFDDLLTKKNLELAIISEFGEELKGGLRMDLYHKFNDWFVNKSKNKATCIPGDIGLEIDLFKNKILCHCCHEYKSKDSVLPIAYGKEEAIFFVCDECNSVLSHFQIDDILGNYHQNGRELKLVDESKQ